jgi:type IV pilus assembly protein PilY1
MVKDNARSFWTVGTADGNDVVKCGLGALLNDNAARSIYYWTGAATDLTDPTNAFSTANTNLSIDSTVVDNVLKFKENWKLGAIIHSEPSVVHYSTSQSVIYVGANDGMLHCFDDTTGKEVWGFIPPGQKSNLSLMSDANHDYYVDGSPTISYGSLISGTTLFQPQYLIFGERRGGDHYYVLDVSNYKQPLWKYQINPDIISAPVNGGEVLGQSWSKPKVCNIAIGTETINGKTYPIYDKVFMIAGGYDVNQDLTTPDVNDGVGKAIFSIKASTGALLGFRVTDNTPGVGSYMTHSIVDFSTDTKYTMKTNGAEITTRVYAGNLGGRVFVFSDDKIVTTEDNKSIVKSRIPDGTFPTKFCLFNTEGKRKIFYAPTTSSINNSYSEWVVFGTGDREDPLDTSTVNSIYVVKNSWLKSNLTQDNLVNLTNNLLLTGTDDEKKQIREQLQDSDGWFINFSDPGEKMISSPIIANGYIFFTTYVPAAGAVSADPCSGVGATGASYLWAIDLATGMPANDKDGNGKDPDDIKTPVAVMAQPKSIGDYIITPAPTPINPSKAYEYLFWRQR